MGGQCDLLLRRTEVFLWLEAAKTGGERGREKTQEWGRGKVRRQREKEILGAHPTPRIYRLKDSSTEQVTVAAHLDSLTLCLCLPKSTCFLWWT